VQHKLDIVTGAVALVFSFIDVCFSTLHRELTSNRALKRVFSKRFV